MHVKKRRTLSLGHTGYWMAAAMIGLMGWTLYRSILATKESTFQVNYSVWIMQSVAAATEAMGRAESAHRGYLISQDKSFLAQRDRALVDATRKMDDAAKLTADNPLYRDRIAGLKALIGKHVGRVSAAGEGTPDHTALAMREVEYTRIWDAAADIKLEETRLIEELGMKEGNDHDRSLAILLASCVLCIVVLVPGYVAFIVEGRARNRAERRLLDLANSLPGAVYRLRKHADGNRSFEFLSQGVMALRGVERDVALQDFSALWNTIVDEDKPAVAAILAKAESELTPVQYEFRVKQPGDAIKWLRASATLRKSRDGATILWNGYWADITREKGLQRELEDAKEAAESANRGKSTFLATMSHEIRTPMNGVLGMLEVLALTHLDQEQQATLEIVRGSGKDLLRIIDDILDFSKIEAGKLEVNPEVASVATVLERVIGIYSGNASVKGLVLKQYIDPRISPALLFDPVRVQQILNNFVSNAIKFTARGHVLISAELVDSSDGEDLVLFSVEDSGIGISEDEQKRLFKPFMQGRGDSARRFGGTGLGLTICRRLADLMRGTIGMTSTLGRGSTLTLTLPLPIADSRDLPKVDMAVTGRFRATLAARRATPSVQQAQAEGVLVLVADDHPINRRVLMRQANTLGYAAEIAENGHAALEMWKSGRFAALITDCNMPEMDGYELTGRIRKLEAAQGLARIPIIACTANAMEGEAENCFAAGMDDYMSKPVQLNELLAKLDRWLPLPTAQSAAIDPSVLAQISGEAADFEREFLIQFRQVNDDDARQLVRAVEKSDVAAITHLSHRIKGACRAVGALQLADACERIEHASRGADLTTVAPNMDSFHRELERLNDFLGTGVPSRNCAVEG